MFHRLEVALLIAFSLCQFASAQQPLAEDQVANASKQFDVAFNEANFGRLSSILAADVIMTSGGGRWSSRAIVLEFMQSLHERRPGITLNTLPELIEVGPQGWNVVSERGRWIERWVYAGQKNEITGSYQSMWKLVGGKWKLSVFTIVPVQCSGPYCVR